MTKRPYLPSLVELAEWCEPRVHPNGFIQLDLDARHRLHVWHPRLPVRQRTFHPVHDHIFDFESFVYSGRMVHVEYDYDVVEYPLATHRRWQVEVLAGNDTVLGPTADRVILFGVGHRVTQPGESYSFPKGRFHESLSNEPTLTIIRKDNIVPLTTGANCHGASVMVPIGVEPDNEFRREGHDTDLLWGLIAEAHPS